MLNVFLLYLHSLFKGMTISPCTGLPEGQFGRRLSNQERQSVGTQKFYSNSNRKIPSNRN